MASLPDGDGGPLSEALLEFARGNELETEAAGRAPGGPSHNGRFMAATVALSRSARRAGLAAVASGRWLSDTVMELGSSLPIRNLTALEAQNHGLSGPALADALIRETSRRSAAVGMVAGALMGAEELLP